MSNTTWKGYSLRAFSVAAPILWNETIRNFLYPLLRKNLKHIYFKIAFQNVNCIAIADLIIHFFS